MIKKKNLVYASKNLNGQKTKPLLNYTLKFRPVCVNLAKENEEKKLFDFHKPEIDFPSRQRIEEICK